MAGKFRGDVGKLTTGKLSKSGRRVKGKKVVAMVKRSPKLPENLLHSRIAQLTSTDSAKPVKLAVSASAGASQQKKQIGKAALEIVGTRKEKIIPEAEMTVMRSSAESQGLKILHQAVKNQSYNKLLPHQNRHDYEYRLRSVATMGVVQLFNSLAQARKASMAVETEDTRLTADKAIEKQQTVSREAFLAALRQSQRMQQF